MTVFLLDERAGVWFDLEGGGRVHLRPMTPDTIKAIRKQTVKRRVEYKRIEGKAERFEVEEIDEDLQNALFWDHIILGWENILDGRSEEIPCTRETKTLLMSRSAAFARFIGESLKTLNEAESDAAEADEKN